MRYRRVDTLVCYWEAGELRLRDYAQNTRRELSPLELAVLVNLSSWRSVKDLQALLTGHAAAALRTAVRRLHTANVIESSEDRRPSADLKAGRWGAWAPDAALLHFGTKNLKRIPLSAAWRALVDQLELDDFPDPLKRIPGARRRQLPDYPRRGQFPRLLLERRTWRRFGPGGVTIADVATLLGLTWAVQGWLQASPRVRSPLKTSPSGGACHSIEVYLVAANVRGLPRGVYHYCPDSHEIETVRRGLRKDALRHYLRQPWFSDCPALFVMTSVFGRVRWKYPSARAYRVLLMEAGHFCQTFCLVATWLGLAPFSTAAFADTPIERALGIDGVEEGVLYAAGVGPRPPTTSAAERNAFPQRPPATKPAHLFRRQRDVTRR